ncbi:pyrroline-5-carboxylate reductase [Schaalia sp. Marseille-Q2122]|uniref:pyrroline-5-carboxylate reductase n=1 Tax=Schaalia sp. Marseille-Q2122 TaxID=2736604 RepID=UPI00158E1D84|nr:pyrroline-5-carboxylate reductase [Schaalia sp. Marseille-Q2122]
MRIGFIGAGSMVGAIARGAVAAGMDGTSFLFTDARGVSAPALAAEVGGAVASSNEELAQQADLIILGVKPQAQGTVIAQIRKTLNQRDGVAVVSIAAGRSLDTMAQDFGAAVPLMRAMPNVNAQVGASMTALCANDTVTPAQREAARSLLSAVGSVIDIEEKDFPVFTALAGCSPAWVFQMIEAFGRAGVKYGLKKAQSVEIAATAILGSAQLMLEAASKGANPSTLIDQVTSPGGSTIAGLLAGEEAGLSTAIVHAVDAAVGHDHRLG